MPSGAPVAMPQSLQSEPVHDIPEYSLEQFAAMVANPSAFNPAQPQLDLGAMPLQMDGAMTAAAATAGYQELQSLSNSLRAEMGDNQLSTFGNNFSKPMFNFDFSNMSNMHEGFESTDFLPSLNQSGNPESGFTTNVNWNSDMHLVRRNFELFFHFKYL